MKTVTYPVCECGAEIRQKQDGFVLRGAIYKGPGGHEPVLVSPGAEDTIAVCRNCFARAVGWHLTATRDGVGPMERKVP